MKPRYPARVSLAHLPTPLEKMERLTGYLKGPQLFIKRDDQTGLALGGNKTRKLEFLVADALAQGKNHLITTGAAHSNHCRQTAAAAASQGLGCTLVLRGQPPSGPLTGNLLLDHLLGAEFCWAGERSPELVMQETAEALLDRGRQPYIVPLGGSNIIGDTAYVLAMGETMDQLAAAGEMVDVIAVATSSGGTQAGLVLGARVYGFQGRILGISIDQDAEEFKTVITELAEGTAERLGLGAMSLAGDVLINDDYLGDGYGVVGDLERRAINLLASQEGIPLDPVYTGRAMGGLLDLIKQGAFSRQDRVLFWHTGGTPGLFTYGEQLLL
ncbi:MAG: D-cysteine desulfhydrase family protein [Chloroflexota bacterium]|jgi:D-cysteine desulfhydrase family pyridoxal phosphate-dependent enzyme